MSVEIQAGWPCPHFIQEEPVVLGTDGRSLSTSAPVSGAASVRILINDTHYVPSTGLDAQAVLTSAQPGPYKIRRCQGTIGPDGNLFIVNTNEGTAEVRLPLGERVLLSRVQRALRLSGVNDLVGVLEKNNSLSLVERAEAGTTSFIRVSGEGADALGFLQKGGRGSQVYPPWDLVSREDVYPTTRANGLVLVPARFPQFKKPLRGNPTLKVTYVSTPERCPRCGGTWVENDYRFDPQGTIITIQNEDLLVQACMKAILTVQGSNPYHPKYGSRMTTRIGRKLVNSSAMLIKEDVMAALQQVQNLQQGQRRYQPVRNRELLFSVQGVDVRTSPDPSLFFVDVVVRNGSNQPVSLSTTFAVPGSIALAGTNNQVLGLDAAGLTVSQSRQLTQGG